MLLLQANVALNQNSFFDVKSLGSLAVASVIVNLGCNAVQTFWDRNPKWLAVVIAMIYSFALVLITESITPVNLLLAVLNGLLIWSTAIGANVIKSSSGGAGFTANAGRKRRFWDPWL